MFSGDNTDFAIAIGMAHRAKNSEIARRRESRQAAATQARLSNALRASQQRIADLEEQLKLERGRRLQRELIETRRALYG